MTAQRVLICVFLLFALLLIRSKIVRVDPISTSRAGTASKTEATLQAKRELADAKASTAPSQIISTASGATSNDPQLEKIFCAIQEKAPYVPLSGDVKIQFHGGKYAAVFSSGCPLDTYSVVTLGETAEDFRVVVDCRDATMETLVKLADVQWSINDRIAPAGELNFAIAGPGNFLVYCPGEGFVLTRRGHFRYDDGNLLSDDGCYLWRAPDEANPGGGLLTLPSANEVLIGDCFAGSDQCIANIELTDPGVTALNYIDPTHMAVNFESLPAIGGRALIFNDSLEDLDNDHRGHTGLHRWDYTPSLKFPISCH